MDKKLASIIKYFAVFDYFPSFEDVYTFFPEKISQKKLKIMFKAKKYTVGEYSKRKIKDQSASWRTKIKNSEKKLNNWRFRAYIKLISLFPQIRLVGLSGSISMMNAKEGDDIDLFIITGKNRLFTGRFIAMVLAQILGLRRYRQLEKLDTVFFDRHTPKGPLAIFSKKMSSLFKNNHSLPQEHKDKVCLNLFFDESNLKVPKFKRTEFVGHEVLQMKPIIVKSNIYERFLEANQWVFELFPNAKSQIINYKSQINYKRLKFKILNLFETWNLGFIISNNIESILKDFQLTLIDRHRTTEIITSSQLWFHPDDFEKKINADKKRIDTDS